MNKVEDTICAVVVTYNRKHLLVETLTAVINQSLPLSAIYIIDNASTDLTEEFLVEKKFLEKSPPSNLEESWEITNIILSYKNNLNIHYVKMPNNTGGAGGFYEGIKRAIQKGYDWVWLMDDDVIPNEDALKELLKASERLPNIGFLCSRVIGEDGSSMNVPEIDFRVGNSCYPEWGKYLEMGIVKVKSATFVSVLINTNVIRDIGLPIKEMFIWGDDTEYTTRITNKYEGYLVGTSEVLHKRKQQMVLSIVSEKEKNRIKNYYYSYRNFVYILRKHHNNKLLMKYIIRSLIDCIRCLKSDTFKIYKIFVIIKGLLSGFKFKPRTKY